MTVTNNYYSQSIQYSKGKYSGNFEYGSVSGANNLKKYDSVAKLNVGTDTATKNRPAALTLRQFGISLPTGAEVSSIVVEYAHRKVKGSNQKKAPNVLAPTVSLLGLGSGSNLSKTGVAPTTSMKNRSVTFSVKPTKSQVESNNFGVHISYPKNRNDASGYIELQYIRIKINYTAPNFQISLTPSKSSVNVGESCTIITNISNINGTNYKPVVNISFDEAPNVTFEKTVEGIISISDNNIRWNPQISSSKRSDSGGFSVYCSTSGLKTIKMSFNLNGVTYSARCSFTVNPPSIPVNKEPDETNTVNASTDTPDQLTQSVIKEEPFEITIQLTKEQYLANSDTDIIYIYGGESLRESLEAFDFYDPEGRDLSSYSNIDFCENDKFKLKENNQAIHVPNVLLDETSYSYTVKVIPKSVIKQVLTVGFIDYTDKLDEYTFNFHKTFITVEVVPKSSELTIPLMTILKIDDNEELNRISDEIHYFIKSMLKVTTENSYIPNWYKNFRIGVFNNMIENNTVSRLNYTSTDDKIEIIINPPYDLDDSDQYALSLNPSERLYLLHSIDDETEETEEEFEEELLEKDVNNEIVDSKVYVRCEEDSFTMTVNLYENDQIIWSQLYSVNLNNPNFEEMTETIIDYNDYENLTIEDIFNYAEYWSSALSTPNTLEEKTVDFMYDSQYPLYILFTGDYFEGDPLNNIFSFTQPILYEQDDTMSYNSQTYLPTPIHALLEDDEIATLELPSTSSSNPFTVYKFNVDENFETGDHLAVRGLLVSIDVEYSDDLILTAKLKSPTGKIGTRSFVISGMNTENEDGISNQIILGGNFELWGFKISEMLELGEWELELQVDNPYVVDDGVSTFMFKNIDLAFYYITFQDDIVICKVNGEDSRHYGMFIQNVDVQPGFNSNVKFYDIDGSDFNKAYRMNIDKKEITLDFSVEGCTIFETTELLKEIVKLFVNQRDTMNNPIPNRIEFSNYPGEHWDYILENPFDTDVESANYDSTVKLTVPDGTSWANEDIVTSVNGYNNSIVGVNPLIEVSPVSNFVELTETITNQNMSIKYDNFQEGDVIIIDCVNREATLKQYDSTSEEYVNKDITEDVDYNADWFILPIGEFDFNTHGTCSRCTITFTPRG